VADAVEAIGSHRPYRASLGIEKVRDRIDKNRGTRYDPRAVDACIALSQEKGYRMEIWPCL
jgi:HD-GYP domain-containing protein (c-di-GMP phosphodiesterase class II)